MRQILTALALAAALLCPTSGCAGHTPPPGTYADNNAAFNADQFLKDLHALTDTAINLNAVQGTLHLSDADTRIVRDFVLAAGAAAQDYGLGTGTPQAIKDAYHSIYLAHASDVAKLNPTLQASLRVVTAVIDALPGAGE